MYTHQDKLLIGPEEAYDGPRPAHSTIRSSYRPSSTSQAKLTCHGPLSLTTCSPSSPTLTSLFAFALRRYWRNTSRHAPTNHGSGYHFVGVDLQASATRSKTRIRSALETKSEYRDVEEMWAVGREVEGEGTGTHYIAVLACDFLRRDAARSKECSNDGQPARSTLGKRRVSSAPRERSQTCAGRPGAGLVAVTWWR